jgi:ribosomal protein S18 acetylase RimI-like enzyme
MTQADLATVAAIERDSHNPLPPEGLSVFANRLALFPAGCLVVGDPVVGYAIAHPWAGPAPPLGAVLETLPDAPDHLFLHDVALRPDLRGRGLVAALVDVLCGLAAARGLPEIRLAAVHGTAPRWARLGFAAYGGSVSAGYGDTAVAMRLAVPPRPGLSRLGDGCQGS